LRLLASEITSRPLLVTQTCSWARQSGSVLALAWDDSKSGDIRSAASAAAPSASNLFMPWTSCGVSWSGRHSVQMPLALDAIEASTDGCLPAAARAQPRQRRPPPVAPVAAAGCRHPAPGIADLRGHRCGRFTSAVPFRKS
jgi:hypothetical protein